MSPQELQKLLADFLNINDAAPTMAPRLGERAALERLRARLDDIGRAHRRRSLFRLLKACASHLVLEGDESDETQ